MIECMVWLSALAGVSLMSLFMFHKAYRPSFAKHICMAWVVGLVLIRMIGDKL
jgi:hypothetical protein